MILDRLDHAFLYRGLSGGIVAALEYLTRTDFTTLDLGKHELDGERLYAVVARYQTRTESEEIWESHRKYIDVQYVVTGTERFGYAPLHLAPAVRVPYDEEKDVALYERGEESLTVHAGQFMIFHPHDVHAPGLAVGTPAVPAEVLKVVVKVQLH